MAGAVKLAVDDPKQPGWKRYLVKMTGSEALENAPTFPAQLTVSEDSQLKIFVEHSGVSEACFDLCFTEVFCSL